MTRNLSAYRLCINTLAATVLALPIISSFNVQSSLADERNITITNNDDQLSIVEINIAPSDSDNWGSNVLNPQLGPLGPGEETNEIDFSSVDPDICVYDARMIYEDDSEYIEENWDLCAGGDFEVDDQN